MSQRFTTPVKRERDDYVPHSGTQSHMSQRFTTPIRRERDDYVPPFGRLTPGLSMMPGPDDNTEYHARSPWPQTPSRASSARYSRDSTLNPAATPYSQSPTPFYGTYSSQAPCNFSPVQDETPAPQTPPRALRRDGRSRKRRRDEEEEEACEQPTYDSSKEALPDLPAYHPRLPLLKTTASNLVAELARYLRPYRYSSADLVNMVQKAEEATNPPEQKKFLFMLLGVTGVGKSSTINSFLDEPHAAKAASTGESRTCVPTFFTHRLPHQTKLYAVEVHFLDDATRRSFLLEWIRFFCHFYFENDGSWSEEEHQQKSAQADAALKIFRALFCDKWDFQSPAHIRACLQRYRENVDMLLQQMMQWCGALFENYDLAGDNPCLQVEKDDCEELEKSIHPHVFEDSDFEVPSRWPLVEHIRKGISTSDKLQHVDLLDLPGTADANCVRSNIAQKFIKQCDALLVVTDARRAIACDAVDRVSRRWGERFEDGLAVIVTNTDSQINSALAAEMDRKKECLGNYKELAARIEQLDKEKTAISTKIKKIRGDREQKMALLDEKEELTEKLRDLRDQQFDGLVDVRNSFIARKLQDDKSKYLKTGNKLKVFCVSNTHYQSLNKEKSSDDRQMNAQTTGIPKLRRHALEMAAPRVFREADAFINKAMTVLRGASLWVEATPTRRHEELMAVVKRPALELVNDIDEYLVRLQGSHSASTGGLIGDKLLQPLEICREDSVAAAIGVKHSIDKWNPATIRAFFNNNGKH
ncbi:hypothetical protein DOTSEDRAFT_53811 [Dothistroma septosporum NZE10]|uniref:Uncharacterized protein n=1 Tax=Dothistroma septosporum (strain NZE10 / CBS 128990) TaxID=675120 RepID=M2YLB6_DOTSN|nr:hypothetical protein DOTSEDRAFT_53811 [Dothistroma septosporum NZE10]